MGDLEPLEMGQVLGKMDEKYVSKLIFVNISRLTALDCIGLHLEPEGVIKILSVKIAWS